MNQSNTSTLHIFSFSILNTYFSILNFQFSILNLLLKDFVDIRNTLCPSAMS